MARERSLWWFPLIIAAVVLTTIGAAMEAWGMRSTVETQTRPETRDKFMDPVTRSELSGTWRYCDERSGQGRVRAAIEDALGDLEPEQLEPALAAMSDQLVPKSSDQLELFVALDRVDVELPNSPAIEGAPLDETAHWHGHPDAPKVWHSLDGRVLQQRVIYEDGGQVLRLFSVTDGKLAVGTELRSHALSVPIRYTLHYERVIEGDAR